MGLRWIFSMMVSVLLHPEEFWKRARQELRDVNALRDYAAPVIAMAQFLKLPFVGVPRMAMLLAIISFVIDVAVLFLLSGVILASCSREPSESVQRDIMTVLSFSLTPVWLAEPFYFSGWWRLVVTLAALVYAVVITRFGMSVLPEKTQCRNESFSRSSVFLVAAASLISFMLTSGLARFFTSF